LKKEQIKSIILIILIVNCLQLTGQIWLDKKLWPSGYNFFNSVKNSELVSDIKKIIPFFNNRNSGQQSSVAATMPKKVIVNGGGAREVYYDNQKQYEEVCGLTKDIMSILFKNPPKQSPVSVEQWQGFLKGKSIYVDFGFDIDASSMARYYGVAWNSNFNQFISTNGLVLSADTVTNEVIICIIDTKTGNSVKYLVNYSGEALIKYIEGLTFGKQQNHAFAFELNLDRTKGSADVKKKVSFNPLVMLPLSVPDLNAVNIYNPVKNENMSQTSDKIITAFGYAPSSLRKSITQEGVVSYVENSATVRVYPNGIVEYNAVLADKGIKLQGNSDPNTVVDNIAKIAKTVWKNAGIAAALDVRLKSDLVELKGEKYIIKMDYSVNGIPVITRLEGDVSVENAIYAEVQDGYVKNFKMVLRTFSETNQKVASMPVLEAIDKLFATYNKDSGETNIIDIFQCYSSEGEIISKPQWVVILDKNSQIVIGGVE